jgi:hypothetical protein
MFAICKLECNFQFGEKTTKPILPLIPPYEGWMMMLQAKISF